MYVLKLRVKSIHYCVHCFSNISYINIIYIIAFFLQKIFWYVHYKNITKLRQGAWTDHTTWTEMKCSLVVVKH